MTVAFLGIFTYICNIIGVSFVCLLLCFFVLLFFFFCCCCFNFFLLLFIVCCCCFVVRLNTFYLNSVPSVHSNHYRYFLSFSQYREVENMFHKISLTFMRKRQYNVITYKTETDLQQGEWTLF